MKCYIIIIIITLNACNMISGVNLSRGDKWVAAKKEGLISCGGMGNGNSVFCSRWERR